MEHGEKAVKWIDEGLASDLGNIDHGKCVASTSKKDDDFTKTL